MTTFAGVMTANAKDNLTGSPDGTYALCCPNILRFVDMHLSESTAVNKMTLMGRAINRHNFGKTGTQLQNSHGTFTKTLSVCCSLTLRTKSGSTSMVISYTAGGAVKLGGTKILGSNTFDSTAAITNANNTSFNAAIALRGLANDNFGDETSFEAIYGENAI